MELPMRQQKPLHRGSKEGAPPLEGWTTFRHPTLRFSLRYPDDWKPATPKSSDTCFAAKSKDEKVSFGVIAYEWERAHGIMPYHLLRNAWGYSDSETKKQMTFLSETCQNFMAKNPDGFVRKTEFLTGEGDRGVRLTLNDGSTTNDFWIFKKEQLLLSLRFDVPSLESETMTALFQRVANSVITPWNPAWEEECWFCSRNGSEADVILNVVIARWRASETIRVPQCGACKAAHDSAEKVCVAGALVGVAAAIIGGIAIHEGSIIQLVVGLLIFLTLSAGIGYGIGWVISRALLPAGVKPESACKKFPEVKKKLDLGWKVEVTFLGSPPEAITNRSDPQSGTSLQFACASCGKLLSRQPGMSVIMGEEAWEQFQTQRPHACNHCFIELCGTCCYNKAKERGLENILLCPQCGNPVL